MFKFLSQYQNDLQALLYDNEHHELDDAFERLVEKAYVEFNQNFDVSIPAVRQEYVRMLLRTSEMWDHMGFAFLLKYADEVLSHILEEFNNVAKDDEKANTIRKWLQNGISLSNSHCYPSGLMDNFFVEYWRYAPRQLRVFDKDKLYEIKTMMVEKTYQMYGLQRSRWPNDLRHHPMIPSYSTNSFDYRISSESIYSYGVFLYPELMDWTSSSDNWSKVLDRAQPYLPAEIYDSYKASLTSQEFLMVKYDLTFLMDKKDLISEKTSEISELHF